MLSLTRVFRLTRVRRILVSRVVRLRLGMRRLVRRVVQLAFVFRRLATRRVGMECHGVLPFSVAQRKRYASAVVAV
jgi:hypothetical protein